MAQSKPSAYSKPLLFGFWVLISVAFIAKAIYTAGRVPLLADTDDAMRLTEVHDFLAGQNWFDHTQYRINTPFGAQIHWSRLIDVPIALLDRLFAIITPAHADMIAVSVWPLLLLLGLLALSSKLAETLAGPGGQLPGLALPVFSLVIMAEFIPGRIDHHSVQILLTLSIVLTTILAWTRPRPFAALAGLAAATSLAIGAEGIVFVAAAVIGFGLMWAADPGHGPTLRRFGTSFALATLGQFLIFMPPSLYFAVHVDVLSIVYVTAALGVGLVFWLLPALPLKPQNIVGRLVAGLVAGGVLLAVLIGLFPEILAGPYAALDPWLKRVWLDNVSEAKPIWGSFAAMPAFTASIVLPPAFALIATLWRLVRGPREGRAGWLLYGLFLAFAFIEMVLQIRGARLAAAMAVPAGAYVVLGARAAYLEHKALWRILPLAGAWLAFASIPLLVLIALVAPPPVQTASDRAARAQCLMPKAFAPLKDLPAQRAMAPIDLGSHLILNTALSVVGAPYHRNQQGLLDTFHFFNGPPAEAENILLKRGITLVVTCPAMTEMKGLPDADPNALVRDLSRKTLPAFLKEVPLKDTPLRLYEVVQNGAGASD